MDTREDLYCLTLAQTEALIAVIEHWRYLTRWLDDDPETALSFAAVSQFVNDTQRRLMMPCGSDNIIVISQFTPDGDFQESTDGGATYHDAPNHDPRNAVPLPPPFLPEGTEEAECTYADAIVNQFINSWINATGDGEELATVITGILGFLAGLLGAVGAVVAVVVLAIAASVVSGTVAAWKAAFTSAVWTRFRCNLHDNQQPDGSFTAADVDAIYARLGDEETGIVLISLQQMVAALGWQGLTVAARTGVGSPTADCDCFDGIRVYVSPGGGTEDDWDGTWLTATPVHDGDHYTLFVQTTPDTETLDVNNCGFYEVEILSGTLSVSDSAYRPCGGGSLTPIGLTPLDVICTCQLALRNLEDAPFQLRVRALACP